MKRLVLLLSFVSLVGFTKAQYWTTYSTSNSGIVYNNVIAVAINHQGIKWFGTNRGVSKFDGTNWTTYTRANSGLACDTIMTIAIDSLSHVSFGTRIGGVSKFDGVNWITYTTTDGLPSNWIYSITINSFGNKWIGTYDAGALKI